MTIENIKELMDGVDIGALLPDLQSLAEKIPVLARVAVLLGPLVLLFLGLHYLLLAPKEANYSTGYRFVWGMGSEESWRFMQRVAGIAWTVMGLALLILMAIQSMGFGQMELMDLLWKAAGCIAMQAALVLLSCLVINLIIFACYDRKGNRRLTWRELLGL